MDPNGTEIIPVTPPRWATYVIWAPAGSGRDGRRLVRRSPTGRGPELADTVVRTSRTHRISSSPARSDRPGVVDSLGTVNGEFRSLSADWRRTSRAPVPAKSGRWDYNHMVVIHHPVFPSRGSGLDGPTNPGTPPYALLSASQATLQRAIGRRVRSRTARNFHWTCEIPFVPRESGEVTSRHLSGRNGRASQSGERLDPRVRIVRTI